MHIFLTNDDGVGARGIMALYRAAVARGHEVTMCAPRHQQSAAGHRFTLVEPMFMNEYPLEHGDGYAVDGAPADCVRIGIQKLAQKPVDVVISGINDGYNAGIATHYSGTVGAAMEGAFHNLPSIAVSIHHKATQEMFDHLADFTIRMAEQYAGKPQKRATILNINAPCVAPGQLKEPVYAPLDTAFYLDSYERRTSPRSGDYFWLEEGSPIEPADEGSDNWYLERGHITLTIMGNFETASQAEWDALHIESTKA